MKENNKNILPVALAALHSDADILSFQELQEYTLEAIDKTLSEKYPYKISDVSRKGYGMAVYSKYPVAERSIMLHNNFPVISGVIKINDNSFHFISATTSSPKNDKAYDEQIRQFKILSEHILQIDSPLIVMGDMNAVPWSEQIEKFLETTKLEDSRKNLSATFPANSILQVPIDYIFHSQDLYCVNFRTLEQTTSNHLGIIGYYKFKPQQKNQNKKKSAT